MAYKDKYLEYLEDVPKTIEKSHTTKRRPVLGYTSNYDVVLKWDVNIYNQILEEYLVEEPMAKEGEIIASMEDFARISSYYLIHGLGGNFDISALEVCKYLENKFDTEVALGGTCAQGAAALGTLGFPVNTHITDKSKEVCELMNYEGLTVIEKGEIVPIMEQATDESPVYHFIVQFSKDDKLIIGNKEYVIPLSNRLILFFDEVHKDVPITDEFLDFWNHNTEKMSSYLVSGFDAVVDIEIMKSKLERLEKHFQKIKSAKSEFIFYFEGAFYMNPKSKELSNEVIGCYADILGMNEEELVAQVKRFGTEVDISKIEEVLKGLDILLEQYTVKGIILHTKDYSLYYGEKLEGIDIEKGLTMGNIMSGTRARIGRYGTREDCKESLELGLSQVGMDFAKQLDEMDINHYICIVPSRYLEHPKYTIGLGDTFVAGVHTCFI